MTSPLPGNTSGTARLLLAAPSYAVGWQERIYVPPPAAGAQWTYKSDGRYWERLVAVRWNFAASAVVATRFTTLQLKDVNGVILTEVPAGSGVVASTAVQPSLTTNAPGFATGAQFQVPGYLPDLLIPGDWTWGTVTSAMDVGDQFSSIVVVVHRFPNDAAAITAE